MLIQWKSQAATRSLASRARATIGAVWAALMRPATALARVVRRARDWSRTVRALRELDDETLRDIGVPRDQISALVQRLLDEGGLDEDRHDEGAHAY
jgi:uncharacterized protein YjiS (DUF1127 family)